MDRLFKPQDSINQKFRCIEDLSICIDMKREDLLHKEVSGNKLRKLYYNLIYARRYNYKTIVTYGGAYSNHIAATAAAGRILGMKTIGVIRGDELGLNLDKTLKENTTLRQAHDNGMKFQFVTREEYRLKESESFHKKYKDRFNILYYSIPEGGTNDLAVKGTQEILTDSDKDNYDIICVAAGTGGTAAGIINSAASHQKIIVFSALKGNFIRSEIEKFTLRTDFEVVNETNFGGYAKSDDRLIYYMNSRFRESGIPLEPIYTGKMMYGIEQMVESGVIKGKSRILAIHTGGLQSIAGYNKMLVKKHRLKLSYENEF